MTYRGGAAGSFAIPIRFTVGTGEAQDDVSGWWAGRDSRGLSDFHLDNCLNNLKFDLFSPSQPVLTRIGF
jgi:hypothetical protein